MGWLEFIASLVGSLAWPAMLFGGLLLFRRQLLALAPFLQEMEAAGVKFKFAKGLEAARAEAEQNAELPPSASPPDVGPQAAPDTVLLLAMHAPRALVTEAWSRVEQAMRHAAGDTGSPSVSRAPKAILQELLKDGRINAETAKVIDDLRQLRNQVAHLPSFAVGTDQALEYHRLADRVTAALS